MCKTASRKCGIITNVIIGVRSYTMLDSTSNNYCIGNNNYSTIITIPQRQKNNEVSIERTKIIHPLPPPFPVVVVLLFLGVVFLKSLISYKS